jgi:Methyltransferase domain
MFAPNVDLLMSRLAPSDLVLDVGGWACPFNRAQWVLDAEPFETRGYYATIGGLRSQGGDKEWFTRDTWVRRDICDRTPWPFRDKQFDFAICSHTLEDVRDPLGVCSELMRVAKRGYIEVPSREWESCRGLERPGQVGLSHHRWLITIKDNNILFHPKYHLIHSHWRFSLRPSHFRRMAPEKTVQWLWWDDSFKISEATIHGLNNLEAELERFVRETRPYPGWQLAAGRGLRGAAALGARAAGGLTRFFTARQARA